MGSYICATSRCKTFTSNRRHGVCSQTCQPVGSKEVAYMETFAAYRNHDGGINPSKSLSARSLQRMRQAWKLLWHEAAANKTKIALHRTFLGGKHDNYCRAYCSCVETVDAWGRAAGAHSMRTTGRADAWPHSDGRVPLSLFPLRYLPPNSLMSEGAIDCQAYVLLFVWIIAPGGCNRAAQRHSHEKLSDRWRLCCELRQFPGPLQP